MLSWQRDAPARRRRMSGERMGRPVVHFEIMGQDGAKLRSFYASLFEWELDADNEFDYGVVDREGNLTADGVGIGGGVGGTKGEWPGHVTFYVEVPDVEASLVEAEELGGTRLMGPEEIMEGVEIGMFNDPEGNMVGVIKGQPQE
jgi:uncharacterized protein